MGKNYGDRRGRMEILRPDNDIIIYSLGTTDIKFEHADEQLVSDIVNEKLDDVDARLQE